MAVITGTTVADFIHRLGDGFTPGGLHEVTGVTIGDDQISGDVGNDVIFGDAGNDTVSGNDGNDTIVGGQGTDRLIGGVGNDAFLVLQLSDISGLAETVNGGSDFDTLDFQFYQASGPIDLSTVTLIDIEALLFTNSDMTMTSVQLGSFVSVLGSGFVERLILTDGGLVDLSGAVMAGLDEIRGNALVNQITLAGVAQGQFLNLLDGNDSAIGGDGSDHIEAGNGNDSLLGGLGNDTLSGGDGVDTVAGGAGNDVINGGTGTDSLLGRRATTPSASPWWVMCRVWPKPWTAAPTSTRWISNPIRRRVQPISAALC